MHINQPRYARPKGFTLIETLVVMIVGIVILSTAAAGIGRLFRHSEISTEANNIMQMTANLRNLRNGTKGYKHLTNWVAVKYKAVPATMSQDTENGHVSNTWNGDVFIQSVAPDDQAFSILYTKVPSEACQQLTLKLRGAGWSRMLAGEALITSGTSLSEIGKACDKKENTLYFISSS